MMKAFGEMNHRRGLNMVLIKCVQEFFDNVGLKESDKNIKEIEKLFESASQLSGLWMIEQIKQEFKIKS
ncbi:MAG: hypothetical protein KAS32_15700 [Candidatus Peribacteraceae bacterium]|nr:hypothetical protein [Candidatus Peribacteraceae bacterium]